MATLPKAIFRFNAIPIKVVLVVKNLPANAGDLRGVGSIPGSGRSPGRGHVNLHQYSCLKNPKDRGTSWATVYGVAKSPTCLKQLSTHAVSIYPHDFSQNWDK